LGIGGEALKPHIAIEDGKMTCLDDFLGPLFEDTKEVIVRKSDVSEPLDAGWKNRP